MKFDIYFHNDFDGRASAAVMFNFLESRGDEIENYIAVDFNWKKNWPELTNQSAGGNPFIVMDFLYQPKAAFWFDHHSTTFLKEEWENKFKNDKFHVLDPEAPSACGLVLKSLVKNFGYKPPKHIKELAKWLDVIDAAGYKSARQTIEKKEPALKIEELIDDRKKDDALTVWTVKKLAAEPLVKITAEKKITGLLKKMEEKRKKSLEFYKKNLKIFGKMGYINIAGKNVTDLRYVLYYFYPRLVYGLIVKSGSGGVFHFSFGGNPWRRKENKIDIGKFMKKTFGGGGHKYVGGAEAGSRERAGEMVKKIIAKFGSF